LAKSFAYQGVVGMWTRHHKKKKFGRLILPAVTIAFLSYFGYHSLHGDYGLRAAQEFERQRFARSSELAVLVAQRTSLEKEVGLLSDGSLDEDIIDEKARYQLNMSRPDEIVIFNTYF
jgi:cell division protein FtsB